MAEQPSSQRTRLLGWRIGPFVAWLPTTVNFGPWPLWRWGTRVGWAFDLGYVRVGVRWR